MRHTLLLVGALVLFILETALVADAATLSWGKSTYNSTAEATVRNLVMAEHYRVCKRSLTNDMRLVTLARWRAADMAINDYFGHADRLGHRLGYFLTHAGIPYRFGGENIGWNTYTADQTAYQVYRAWMGSTTHRGLIRNCDFRRVGVGSFREGSRFIWVLELLQPPL